MVARSSRLGHSGPSSPGRRYESSRHGLAASRPRTPGSGAVRFHSPPTKPSSRLGTRHIVRCNAVARSAPLPVRHPGPRVTAAGCYTPAPSGLATTASQSGQRRASYHPPRLIMSAARDKMLSTPCRARLRAARHYRTPACSPGTPHRACDVVQQPVGSDGRKALPASVLLDGDDGAGMLLVEAGVAEFVRSGECVKGFLVQRPAEGQPSISRIGHGGCTTPRRRWRSSRGVADLSPPVSRATYDPHDASTDPELSSRKARRKLRVRSRTKHRRPRPVQRRRRAAVLASVDGLPDRHAGRLRPLP